MSGIIVPVLPKRLFDFTYLEASAAQNLLFQSALNAVPFSFGRLLVRVHYINMDPSLSQSLQLAVYGTNPSSQDTQEFWDPTALLSITIDKNNSNGDLLNDTSTDIFPFLKIGMIATQGSTAGAVFAAELSADLVLRDD